MTSAERVFWRSPTCTVWVRYGPDGTLVFHGEDRAHLDGYEYEVSVRPDVFPALRSALGVGPHDDVVDAVCGAADTIMAVGEHGWLRAHGVPAAVQTR